MTDNPSETKPQASFTPGPWHARGLAVIEDATSQTICYILGDAEANARLIAAAPDLYEALERAEGHLAEMLDDPRWHPIGQCPTLDMVRAALRAAGMKC